MCTVINKETKALTRRQGWKPTPVREINWRRHVLPYGKESELIMYMYTARNFIERDSTERNRSPCILIHSLVYIFC